MSRLILFLMASLLMSTSAAFGQVAIKPQEPAATPLYREAFSPQGSFILLSFPKPSKLNGKPILHWGYHKRKIDDLIVTNALGKTLPAEEVIKRLRKPTILLLSADGKPVHPYYLKVIKPDTLVIIDNTPK